MRSAIAILCVLWAASIIHAAPQYAVRTLNGKQLEGSLRIGGGIMSVQSINGGAIRTNVDNLLELRRLDNPNQDLFPKYGVLLNNGARLAADRAPRLEDGKVTFKLRNKSYELPERDVQALLLAEVPDGSRNLLRRDTPGVILADGDFYGGETRTITHQIEVASVLFGVQTFRIGRPALAVVLRRPQPRVETAEWCIIAADGSEHFAGKLTLDRDRFKFVDRTLGPVELRAVHVQSIRYTGANIASLPNAITPEKPESSGAKVLQRDDWQASLNGEYDRLLATIKAPADVLPFAHVSVEVYVDGKLVETTKPLVSTSEPLNLNVDLKNAKSLRLKLRCNVEALPGVIEWANPVLVKSEATRKNPAK